MAEAIPKEYAEEIVDKIPKIIAREIFNWMADGIPERIAKKAFYENFKEIYR